jgi:mobilization protein NikA
VRVMPRPRKPEVRDQHLTLRLTLEEMIALRERASNSGRSLTDFARNALLSARPPPRPNHFAFEPATYFQIRMLGVNLNQIARRLNSTDAPAPPELQPLLAAITAALHRAMP